MRGNHKTPTAKSKSRKFIGRWVSRHQWKIFNKEKVKKEYTKKREILHRNNLYTIYYTIISKNKERKNPNRGAKTNHFSRKIDIKQT